MFVTRLPHSKANALKSLAIMIGLRFLALHTKRGVATVDIDMDAVALSKPAPWNTIVYCMVCLPDTHTVVSIRFADYRVHFRV